MKFIFTVEEEIGLGGARKAAKYFLSDVDAAIVNQSVVISKGQSNSIDEISLSVKQLTDVAE